VVNIFSVILLLIFYGMPLNILQKRGLSVSMTEENHCYENAMAERVNGILKQE